MRRFKNILVVCNNAIGADDALSQASALAAYNDAKLTLIDVVPLTHATKEAVVERRKALIRLMNALAYDGLSKVKVEVRTGTDYIEVVKEVQVAGHDLVFASAKESSVMRDALYGNMATQLMRKCPCPVWIIKHDQPHTGTRILAAVDPAADTEMDTPDDIKIMDLASSLCIQQHAELHVLHAWQVQGKDADTLRSEIRDATREQLLKKHEQIYRTGVDRLLARYRRLNLNQRVHMPRGVGEQEIARAAKEIGADVIVMRASGRKGISGLLIKDAAEQILGSVSAGVLVIKPDGFESPVKIEKSLEAA